MKVVFIILNYKTYQDTINLTKKMYNDGLEDKCVLVVDNASPNESYKALKEQLGELKNVEVIASKTNGGYAKGNNIGLRYAKKYNPKYMCIINNDVLFSMETIDHLCEWYEKIPSVAFIAPRQILPDGSEALFPNMDVPTFWTDLSQYNPFNKKIHYYEENCNIKGVNEIGIIPGAFIFANYNLFESLGFFDESTFLFCEERFIAKKAQLAGLKNYIILSETYLHNHSTTIKNEASIKKQRQMIHEGRCLYHKKYAKMPALSVGILNMAFALKELFIRIAK